jgi:hypothetical protein|tara:strand:- start:428 stop:670 length:243 start_codon:yes stop_codon:yes gene_type:complete
MALNCRDELDTARKRQPEIEAVAMEFREEKIVKLKMLMKELESQEVWDDNDHKTYDGWKGQLKELTYTQGLYDKYDKEHD